MSGSEKTFRRDRMCCKLLWWETYGNQRSRECQYNKGFRHGGTSREAIYYDVTAAFGKQRTVDHNTECITGRRHSNGLERFWSCAQERRLQYHGVSKNHCLVYRKEMEWKYHYRNQNLFHPLIKIHVRPLLT